jgi:hypothetical protein
MSCIISKCAIQLELCENIAFRVYEIKSREINMYCMSEISTMRIYTSKVRKCKNNINLFYLSVEHKNFACV